jgi:hypothetical protein
MTDNRRLWKLAAANLVIGVAAAALSSLQLPGPLGLASLIPPFGLRDLPIVPLLASALCQAVLLVLWATSSGASPWGRLAGLVAGAAYLEGLIAVRVGREFMGLSAFTIAATTAALLVARALGVRLAHRDGPGLGDRAAGGGLRFSIRSLMVLTAAVAVLTAGARALNDTPVRFFLLTAVWAACFVAVGLVALRAALGDGRPDRRAVALVILSPALGAFFAVAAQAHHAGWVYIILVMLLHSAMLLGSLLVVRSCGYRLARRSMPTPWQPSPA